MKIYMIRRISNFLHYDYGQMVPSKVIYWTPFEDATVWTSHVRVVDVFNLIKPQFPNAEIIEFKVEEL